ncbi:MAG: hypothetical protein ACD_39C00519G0003, partial [uncultured bacterium]
MAGCFLKIMKQNHSRTISLQQLAHLTEGRLEGDGA